VTVLHAYVGRQAIFDRDLNVVAYELLYRNSDENRARFDNPDQASAATMFNAYLELGLDRLAGGMPVYVNLSKAFLLGEYDIPLPPERTVLEVLEDVPVTPQLITQLQKFRAQGFRIALDDFVLTAETRALVPLADIIKIDVLNVPPDEVRRQYAELRPIARTLLAEKISTHDEMEMLHGLGFELFQGHFLQLPIISRTERMPHNRAALMQLLAKLYDPRHDVRQVEKLIAAEIGLATRLFKLASSAAMSRGAPISTVKDAIARVGTQQVAALAMLAIVANYDDKPIELARDALVRARMCEVLARSTNQPPDQLFTAGLLSLLDALLDTPLQQILAELPVTAAIHEALSTTRTAGGRIIEAARAQGNADFDRVDGTGIPAQQVFMAWYEAVRWADELISLLR
jgi:EAL and modified HD-GYP domain-containing signal transduction protein